jgi:hypothetical protein
MAKYEILEGPHCVVCDEELKPSSAATIVSRGPDVGKFVHFACAWKLDRDNKLVGGRK